MTVTTTQGLDRQSTTLWRLIGKAIAKHPHKVQRLLHAHAIPIASSDERALVDGIMRGFEQGGKSFQRSLSGLLHSQTEDEDHFVGAIAGAVGQVAGAIGSGQQNKAMKEQARAQSLTAIMAYKTQQEQTRLEELKLRQNQKPPGAKRKVSTKTLLIIVGAAIAILTVFGLVVSMINKRASQVEQVTRTK
jgi:hypothetical protein